MKMRAIFYSICCTFILYGQANATIIYEVEASSTFTLITSGGLAISALETPEGPATTAIGTASASVDTDAQSDPTLFPSSPLTQTSAASGSAGSPFGISTTDVFNSFYIDLVNTTDETKTATFTFAYEWRVSLTQAPLSEAMMEAGFASAFFHLSGFFPSGSDTLAIDEGFGAGAISVADWLVNPTISFDFTDTMVPGALLGSATVTAFVTVPENSANRFSVITDAIGAATHIPAPSTMLILLLATMGVFCISKSCERKA